MILYVFALVKKREGGWILFRPLGLRAQQKTKKKKKKLMLSSESQVRATCIFFLVALELHFSLFCVSLLCFCFTDCVFGSGWRTLEMKEKEKSNIVGEGST